MDVLKEAREYWNWKRKYYIALCGELAVQVAVHQSQDWPRDGRHRGRRVGWVTRNVANSHSKD